MNYALCTLLLLPAFAFAQTHLSVDVLTSRMLRLQYDEAQPFTQFAVDDAQTYERDGFLFLQTEALTLRYHPDSLIDPRTQSAEPLRISFRLGNHTVIWYPGKDDAMNLRGTLPSMHGETGDARRKELQLGLLSRAGWSIVHLTPPTEQSFDILFLAYGRDYQQALRDYQQLFPAPLPCVRFSDFSWRSLSFAPYLAATATNAPAVCYGRSWNDDVEESELDDERYVRWMQFSAFLPSDSITISDSLLNSRMQQSLHRNALQEALLLHRTIQPYADSIRATGMPLCRPLYYEWPEENNAYVYEDEFLCGTDYLVAPITRPTQADGLARRPIWLPPGQWYDVLNHRVVQGGRVIQCECPLSEVPYFKRLNKLRIENSTSKFQ